MVYRFRKVLIIKILVIIMENGKKKFLIIAIIIFLISFISFLVLTSEPLVSIKDYPEVDLSSCETDDCLILLAIEESNPNYCKGISEKNNAVCYSSVALKIRDYDLCNKADSYSAQTCKIAIAHDSKDMEACKEYSFEDSVENLMQGNPTKKLCESVIKGKLIEVGDEENSKIEMIMESNFSVCEEYRNNPNIQNAENLRILIETCYYEVAISNQDSSFCEKVGNPLKYYCLGRASAEK